MSCVRINIADNEKIISSEVHGSEGDALIAALSAEPETLAELGTALSRFIKPRDEESPFARFSPHENYEPYDAGILVIDLTARVIGCESTYSYPTKQHEICYHDGDAVTDVAVRYRLPDDWIFVNTISEYKAVSKSRREERLKIEPLDSRKILFGRELLEFLVSEVSTKHDLLNDELFADIHEKWLMTARDDLRGRSPREVLLEKKELIDADLFSREMQWSFSGACPPFLSPDFHAYRCAGFGTHEIVIYYDLIRFLLGEIYAGRHSIEELEQAKNDWLHTPDAEFHGRTPAQIIERERRRIPPAMSAEEALIDHDCPICRMMSEDFETPMFWHLDGCNMDDRFAFSFYLTREEYDAEQCRYEEYNEEFRRKQDASFFDENSFIEE